MDNARPGRLIADVVVAIGAIGIVLEEIEY
jgi:hypothetical protein